MEKIEFSKIAEEVELVAGRVAWAGARDLKYGSYLSGNGVCGQVVRMIVANILLKGRNDVSELEKNLTEKVRYDLRSRSRGIVRSILEGKIGEFFRTENGLEWRYKGGGVNAAGEWAK